MGCGINAPRFCCNSKEYFMKKIAFVSQPEYFRFMYENDLEHLFIIREFLFNFGMVETDFDNLVKFNPDLVFFFRGEYFPEAVLRKLRGKKVALSSEPFPRFIDGKWRLTKDSLRRFSEFYSIKKKAFDYVFHYDVSSKKLLDSTGFGLSGFFSFPVATNVYKPNESKDYVWDIFFIGKSSEHRESFFGQLKNRYKFLHIAHGIWGPDLLTYVHKSRICLNVHASSEISWEPRMQMLLASGACVVSEPITPNAYIKPNIHFFECKTPGEMFDTVRSVLDNDALRQEKIANGLKTVRKNFVAEEKFVQLIKSIEEGGVKRFSPKPSIFDRAWNLVWTLLK